MKLSVVFPSVMYRDGPAGGEKLIRGIEAIGFDELDKFDRVVMRYPARYRAVDAMLDCLAEIYHKLAPQLDRSSGEKA